MTSKLAASIQIRRARIADVPAIHDLIQYWSKRTPVLPKTLGFVYENVREFVVAYDGDLLVGAAALHVDWSDLAEVRSVVVHPERRGQGIGQALVQALVDEARDLGLQKIFCLTDQPGWFASLGFNPVDKADLPHKVWRDCVHCPLFTRCTEVALARSV